MAHSFAMLTVRTAAFKICEEHNFGNGVVYVGMRLLNWSDRLRFET